MRSIVVALALLVAPVGCDRRSFADTDRAAIEKVLSDQATAWNAGDLDGFMAGYLKGPDLVFTSGANIRRGYDASYQKYKKAYADGGNMGKLAFEVLEVRALGPDAAVVLGKYVLTETEKAGDGVFSLVFQRIDGSWKVVHDHTSATPKD